MGSDLLDQFIAGTGEGAEVDDATGFPASCPVDLLELSSSLALRPVKREMLEGVVGALGIHFLALLFLWTGPLLFNRVDIKQTAFMVSLVDLEVGAMKEGGMAAQWGGWGQMEGHEIEAAPTLEIEPLPVRPPPANSPAQDVKEPEKAKPVLSKRTKPQGAPRVSSEWRRSTEDASKSADAAARAQGTSPAERAVSAEASPGSQEGAGTVQGASQGEGIKGGRAGLPLQQEFQLAQVDKPPEIVSRVEPDYPAMARRQRLSGKLVVKFLVDPSGQVRKASVLQATPQGVFESCVLDALAKWRFRPGFYQGRPVATWVVLPIQFKVSG